MRRRLPIVIYRRKRIANLKNASRKLAIYLSILTLFAVLTLYSLDYFPLGNWESHQSALVSAVQTYVSSKVSPKKHEAILAVQAILEQKTKLLLGGDIEEIKENYDLSSTTGEWAYEKAENRAAYLRKWALARGVRMVEATSTFEIDSVSEESDGSFWIELTEHTVYAYEYSPADLFQPAWIYGADGQAPESVLVVNSTSPTGVMIAGWGESHGTFGCGEIHGISRCSAVPGVAGQSVAYGITGQSVAYGTASYSEAGGFARQQARTLTRQMGQSQGESSIRHEFGSRTVHVIEIALSDGKWKIRKDWYMDPLGDDVGEPAQAVSMSLNYGIPGIPGKVGLETWEDNFSMSPITYRPITAAAQDYGVFEALNSLETSGRTAFDRDKALDYAVKHSGVRALPDGGRYNSKYRVYTFVGGDCANFASQVLHAGGIPQGQGWHCAKEGSTAWVQSESLVWHLLSSGRGYRIFRGKFAEAVSASQILQGEASTAMPPVDRLEPGDIIAYEVKGEIHHVAVVVGRDPRGYVTIASHTADRLYFPWDLGWSESIVFWFIKISY
ncbi:MAG: amidase domain-containing protein [Bacillota bacterium]